MDSQFDTREDPWADESNTWAALSSILGNTGRHSLSLSPVGAETSGFDTAPIPFSAGRLASPEGSSSVSGGFQASFGTGDKHWEDNNPTAFSAVVSPAFADPLQGAATPPSPTTAVSNLALYRHSLRGAFNPLSPNPITIKEIPEKEGLVFKHINYLVSHRIAFEGDAEMRKVTRRYSDFAWLLEVLVQKYPFRAIPDLPPKKFTGSLQDTQFLQRRRRGLARFLNQLMKHPVLSKEPLVAVFLCIPTDLGGWRKQANVDLSVEFQGKKIPKEFIASWDNSNLTRWTLTEASLRQLYEQWSRVCILLDRYEKRRRLVASDQTKFASILQLFAAANLLLYDADAADSDIGVINANLKHIAAKFTREAEVCTEEAEAISLSHLECFKQYQDYLALLMALFERYHTFGGNTIAAVSKHLDLAEQKLEGLNAKLDVKGSEVERVKSMILNDKQEIFNQVNRDWLIKQCLEFEYYTFQETQYLITKALQDWITDRFAYGEKGLEVLAEVLNDIADMPLGR